METQYTFRGKENATLTKLSGSVQGQPFVIPDCLAMHYLNPRQLRLRPNRSCLRLKNLCWSIQWICLPSELY
ncbi:hypothetical protein ACHAXN_010845 [Cyclotella atomus]